MFNSLRKTIANFINPTTAVVVLPEGAKNLTYGVAPAHVMNQHERVEKPVVYAGHLTTNDMDLFTSVYLKDQVALGAAWSCLAKAFGEYQKVIGKRQANDSQLMKFMDEFHAWNSVVTDNKQMHDEALVTAVAKMCQPRVNKSNDQADAIIARVRKITVQELKAIRQKEAQKEAAMKEAAIDGFCKMAWDTAIGDTVAQVSGSFVVNKIMQTINFVGNTWTGDGAAIAGELLIMEDDLAKVEKLARQERDDQGDFIDGVLTSDGMMRLSA